MSILVLSKKFLLFLKPKLPNYMCHYADDVQPCNLALSYNNLNLETVNISGPEVPNLDSLFLIDSKQYNLNKLLDYIRSFCLPLQLLPFGSFDEKVYFDTLNVEMGKSVLFTEETTSTHLLLKNKYLVNELESGTVFVAYSQTGGIGRRTNKWKSHEGCLMFSLVLKTTLSNEAAVCVQHTMAAAIAECFPVKIKWPNDILSLKHLKIGGILTCFQGYWIISCGLNVFNCEPTECLQDYVNISREKALALILNKFEPLFLELKTEEKFTSKIKSRYLRNWVHTAQKIILNDETFFISGINEYGMLTATGKKEVVLHPDEHSFDLKTQILTKR